MSLPFESSPGDEHTLTLGGRRYDVYKLIRLTSHIVPVELPGETLRELVSVEHCWTDSLERGFSPRELLGQYEECGSWELLECRFPHWSDHIRKVMEADCQYPILMYRGEVIDGMHRTVRATVDRLPTLRARKLDELPDTARYYGS